MCGPSRPELRESTMGDGFPVLALPKSVAVNSLSRDGDALLQGAPPAPPAVALNKHRSASCGGGVQVQVQTRAQAFAPQHACGLQQRTPCGGGSDADSRSSSPRSHGHTLRCMSEDARVRHAQQHLFGTCWQSQPSARQGPRQCVAGASPLASPRSACSTPGGADNSMGIQLHALVFAPSRQQRQQQLLQQQPGGRLSGESYAGPGRAALAGRHSLPKRNRTAYDLRRSSTAETSSNPWGSAYPHQGSSMLHTIASLGARDSHEGSGWARRGSISKAKQVLAEAISSMPGSHGLRDFAPAACDTGVLAPLLSIIRHNGAPASRRTSFSESSLASSGSSGTACSGSTACGFASGSRCLAAASGQLLGGGNGCCRATRCSSAGDCDELVPCIPPTLPEDGVPAELGSSPPHADELASARARSRAAQLQKVVDCIDTVRVLSVDESNRVALVDLGVVELLLSKLQPAARPDPEVAVACLGALSAICKHDALKQQLWDSADSGAILALLGRRRASPVVRAAHNAAAQLGWSIDSAPDRPASGGFFGGGSVFDSVSSCNVSSAESTSSSCSGANVLLEPALIPALAACLHPAADVPVLLSALKLLSRAASSADYELPAPPLTPDAAAGQAGRARGAAAAWHRVLFALMPLLVPTQRRQGHLVLSAALELLIVLTESHPELHTAVAVAGCLPPLLAQVLDGSSEQSLQAACILTGLVDTPAAQERLSQDPALAVLLRVLADGGRSVDVRLAAVHVLRRLASSQPRCIPSLEAHGAVQAVLTLAQEVPDNDVRRAASGLLRLLGCSPAALRPRAQRCSMDNGSRPILA